MKIFLSAITVLALFVALAGPAGAHRRLQRHGRAGPTQVQDTGSAAADDGSGSLPFTVSRRAAAGAGLSSRARVSPCARVTRAPNQAYSPSRFKAQLKFRASVRPNKTRRTHWCAESVLWSSTELDEDATGPASTWPTRRHPPCRTWAGPCRAAAGTEPLRRRRMLRLRIGSDIVLLLMASGPPFWARRLSRSPCSAAGSCGPFRHWFSDHGPCPACTGHDQVKLPRDHEGRGGHVARRRHAHRRRGTVDPGQPAAPLLARAWVFGSLYLVLGRLLLGRGRRRAR